MAKCKWCEKSSIFISVDEKGVCKKCAAEINMTARSILNVIEDSQRIIDTSKNIDTVKNRTNDIIHFLEAFEQYEERDIQVFNYTLDQLKNNAREILNERITDISTKEFGKDLIKLESLKTEKAYYKHYEKCLLKVDKFIEMTAKDVANFDKTSKHLDSIKNQYEINLTSRFK